MGRFLLIQREVVWSRPKLTLMAVPSIAGYRSRLTGSGKAFTPRRGAQGPMESCCAIVRAVMFGETTKKLTCPRPMISALVDHKRHSEAFHFGLGLDRESDFVLQVVIPVQGLLLRSVSVHDDFVLDAVLSEGSFLRFAIVATVPSAPEYGAR